MNILWIVVLLITLTVLFDAIWKCCSKVNPFVANAPFLYPLKTPENLAVFLGGRERVHWEQMG